MSSLGKSRLLRDHWALSVVHALASGPKRYGEIRSLIPGVSSQALNVALGVVVDEGLATRTPRRTFPPRTDYELTDRGRSLTPIVGALKDWVDGVEAVRPKKLAPPGLEAAVRKGVTALSPFVSRWNLSLNPEDCSEMAYAVLAHAYREGPDEDVHHAINAEVHRQISEFVRLNAFGRPEELQEQWKRC